MGIVDRYIDVVISRTTLSPSVASFDGLLVVADFDSADATPVFSERVREYSDLATIATQFGTAHPVYGAAAAIFSQKETVDKVYVGRVTTAAPETWTAGLDAILAENNEWYGMCSPDRVLADQSEIADWAQINKKLYGISSDDVNVVDGAGDIAEYIDTNSYDYSFVIYHPDSDGTTTGPYPAAAWLGLMFPKDPGSATWAWKQLVGITPYVLTGTQIDTIEGKNGNYYIDVAGISVALKGTVGTGEFMDTIRGSDWLKARIQELVLTPLVNTDKVPYTNAGVGVITNQIGEALGEAVDRDFVAATTTDVDGNIVPGWSISAPEVSTVSAAEKTARNLPDVTFEATLSGAIHTVVVRGTLVL